MNRKAQLLTLDMLLALVPLTIVLGMSASALSGVINQIQEYAIYYSMQRQAGDALDVLIKTPGTPSNWDSSKPPTTPGLAVYSCNRAMSNFLDYDKLTALDETMLSKLFPKGTNVYLEVVNLQSNTTVKTLIHNTTPMENAANVFIAERAVAIGMNTSTLILSYNETDVRRDTINWTLVLPSCPEIKNITILVTTDKLERRGNRCEDVELHMTEPSLQPYFFIGINTVNYSWDNATAYQNRGQAQSDVRMCREDAARYPVKTIEEFLKENLVVGKNDITIEIDVRPRGWGGADVAVFLKIAYSIPVPVEGKIVLKTWR